MAIQIEVQGTHAELLVEFYLTRLKALRTEIIEREQEMKEITQVIQKLKKGDPSRSENVENTRLSAEYSDKWPWVKKIEFAIKQEDRPLTTKEIVELLTEYEPSFLFERKRVVASISSTLSTKSGPGGEFFKTTRDTGEVAYGIDDGSPEEPIDDLPF